MKIILKSMRISVKSAKLANLATSEVDRDRPRTFVADMAINPVTGQAEPINLRPILPQEEDTAQVQENMKQLMEMIMAFFEEEAKKVDSGELKEEEQLELPYVQEIDSSTKRPLRLPPQSPYRRRA